MGAWGRTGGVFAFSPSSIRHTNWPFGVLPTHPGDRGLAGCHCLGNPLVAPTQVGSVLVRLQQDPRTHALAARGRARGDQGEQVLTAWIFCISCREDRGESAVQTWETYGLGLGSSRSARPLRPSQVQQMFHARSTSRAASVLDRESSSVAEVSSADIGWTRNANGLLPRLGMAQRGSESGEKLGQHP